MNTEKFLPAELRLLRRKLSAYGTIKTCCEYTGIHRTTINRLLKTGEASGAVMQKLRVYLESQK